LLRGLRIAAASAAFNETPTAVGLLHGYVLPVSSASFAGTPTAVGFVYNRVLNVISAIFSESPSLVDLDYSGAGSAGGRLIIHRTRRRTLAGLMFHRGRGQDRGAS
jgi:hypothetical protein